MREIKRQLGVRPGFDAWLIAALIAVGMFGAFGFVTIIR
jgi:hypothetical protein